MCYNLADLFWSVSIHYKNNREYSANMVNQDIYKKQSDAIWDIAKLHFFNTSKFTFQKLLGDADGLASNLNNYIAGFSSRARKILEKFKFEEEIEKLEEANRLFEVFKQVASQNLYPDIFDNVGMGYLFEDLDKKKKKPKHAIELTKKTVVSLKEYRSAIITSAVMGEIDVRKVEIPEQQKELA